jgi:hypothetical protein
MHEAWCKLLCRTCAQRAIGVTGLTGLLEVAKQLHRLGQAQLGRRQTAECEAEAERCVLDGGLAVYLNPPHNKKVLDILRTLLSQTRAQRTRHAPRTNR